MAVAELQSLLNDTADIISCVIVAAHFVEFFNGPKVYLVFEDSSDSIAESLLRNIDFILFGDSEVVRIKYDDTNLLLDYKFSIFRLVSESRDANEWGFGGDGLSD